MGPRIHPIRSKSRSTSPSQVSDFVRSKKSRRSSKESPTMRHYESDDDDDEARLKSLFWHVVDRLDSCCTLACGGDSDILHSPPVKEIHFSGRLESVYPEEDVTRFVWNGSFPNDGTFPVSDEELLDARYHSLDEESEVSSVVRRNESIRRDGRGVLREYFDNKNNGSWRRRERHHGPKCRITVTYSPQEQQVAPSLASS